MSSHSPRSIPPSTTGGLKKFSTDAERELRYQKIAEILYGNGRKGTFDPRDTCDHY